MFFHTPRLRLVLLTLALCTAACSQAGEASDRGMPAPEPTFVRAEGDDLGSSSPFGAVSDLVAPAQPGRPWLVAGSVFDPETGESTAAVWSSTDAATWERVDVLPADPEVSESFSGIVVHRGGVRLAAGTVGSGSDADAAVWRESGGRWRRLDVPSMGGEGRQEASAIVADGAQVIVLGSESIDGDGRARLWLSDDGETFRSVDGGAEGVFDEEGSEGVTAIAPAGDGFVAVGFREGDRATSGLAWVSDDGEDWESVEPPAPERARHWSLTSVAARDGVVSAVGSLTRAGQGATPIVWRSSDGRDWAPPAPLPVDPYRATATGVAADRVVATPEGWVAVGGAWNPHVWRSSDAATWEVLPSPAADRFPAGVDLVDASVAGGVVVGLADNPAVLRFGGEPWQVTEGGTFPNGGVTPYANAVTVADGTVLVGGHRSAASTSLRFGIEAGVVWSRTADGTWERELDGLGDGRVTDLAATDAGVVAVGVEQRTGAARRDGDNYGPDGVVWVQREHRWERIGTQPLPREAATPGAQSPSLPPVGGPDNQFLDSVVPLDAGWLAVGGTFAYDSQGVWQGDGLAVISPDGSTWSGEDAHGAGPGDIELFGACAAPDGAVVAVGDWWNRAETKAVVRHRSPQGDWTEARPEGGDGFADQSHWATACAAGDDGYVAVGAARNGDDEDAAVWTSDDGVTWSRLEHDLLGGEGDQRALAVVAVPGGGWLVGGYDTAAGDEDAALWRLGADGDVTRRDEGEPDLGGRGTQTVTDIALVDDGLVVVGRDHARIGLWESPLIDRPRDE